MRTKDARVHELVNVILPHFDNLTDTRVLFDKLYNMGFLDAPASTKFHGAYEGGLFDHSYNVLGALVTLTEDCRIKWERPESPYIVGLFHDLCKCDSYVPIYESETIATCGDVGLNADVIKGYKYNDNMLLKGHGDKSVMIASSLLTLTEEEIMCIRYHMGAFVPKEEWNDYTRAVHKYSTVLWTHTADMLAAHVWEVEHDD